jgi:hypothetical protein
MRPNERWVVVVVRDRDQDASTSLISIPALKSDFRHAHFSTIHTVLYLSGKSLCNNVIQTPSSRHWRNMAPIPHTKAHRLLSILFHHSPLQLRNNVGRVDVEPTSLNRGEGLVAGCVWLGANGGGEGNGW